MINTSVSASKPLWQACTHLWQLESEYYSKRSYRTNNFTYTYTISGEDVCADDTYLVILVHSLHSHADKRDAIRRTWGGAAVGRNWPGSNLSVRIKMAFVLGVARDDSEAKILNDEQSKHRDIIQGNFNEHYHNMTLKSLFGLLWVSRYCPSAKFLLKSDDDMFVNIPYLLKIIENTDMRNSIMGPYNGGSRVYRVGKWAISTTDFPFYYFPPYESGSAYVISTDLVQPLYEASQYVPHIFIDDVYVTGILGRIVGANHVVRDGFAFWASDPPTPCDIARDRVITGTRQTAKSLDTLWKALHERMSCPRAAGTVRPMPN